MKELKTNTPPSPIERTPNPAYNEHDFEHEVTASKQSNVDDLQRKLDAETNPKWRKIWQGVLASYDDLESSEWAFIHEFTRLMPAGMDREYDIIDPQLAQDLDTIFKRFYDYDEYVLLQNRWKELATAKQTNKLSREQEAELHDLEMTLSKYDFKLLYIEMRKLGYTQKDLKTSRWG